MPTVRPYRAQQQVQPVQAPPRGRVGTPQLQTPILNVNPTPEAFGAAAGQTALALGAQGFGQELQYQEQLRQQARQQGNAARMTQEQRYLQDFEIGLHDPEKGAFTRKGQDALNLGQEVDDALGKFANERRAQLPNDELRQAYDQLVLQRRPQILLPVLQHEAQEGQALHENELKAKVTNAQVLAGQNTNDPVRLLDERHNVEQAATQLADSKRMGPEASKLFVADAVSGYHRQVLDNMAATNDQNAATYFESVKDEVIGDDRIAVERTLKSATTNGETQRQADKIWKTNRDATLEQLMDEAAKISNPDIREKTEERLRTYHALRKQDQADTQAAFAAQAKQVVDQAKAYWDRYTIDLENKLDAGLPIDALQKIPGWALAPDSVRKNAISYGKAITEKGGVDTDYPTYYRLMREASDDPQAFMKHDLFGEFMHKLNPKVEMKQLQELQNSIKTKNMTEADKQLDDFRTENQVINDTLGTMGIDAGAKENNAAVSRVHAMVGERAGALTRLTGKKPTNQDIQKIVDDIVSTPEFVPGFFYGSTEKPLVTITISDISSAERSKIEDALRATHRVVTPDAILDTYIRTRERLKTKKKTGGP